MEGLIGLLPIALIALACPLMMIFMMRGMHGGHGEHADHAAHGGAPEAGDEQTATRLQAMEEQVATLRRELAERDVEKVRLGRDGRS